MVVSVHQVHQISCLVAKKSTKWHTANNRRQPVNVSITDDSTMKVAFFAIAASFIAVFQHLPCKETEFGNKCQCQLNY